METIFLGIVGFLMALAIFDLSVGVSNDAVNFINSAVGSRAARFKVILGIATVGIFVGASLSNGMMDIARHGIFCPTYYSFYDLMCIFLAVMVTDIVLLDIFNSLGMPTSTTVSMVFELLGGSFALSIIKIHNDESGLLSFSELLNTEKALSVILAIFLSVAIAFIFGFILQWLSRIVFTFTYNKKSKVKIGIFGGIATTSIVWFLLINGLKGSTLNDTPLMHFINENAWGVIGLCFLASSIVMTLLSYMKVNVFRIVVLLGTFALAMAFAGNDLVNFIGVPLAGLSSYLDFTANGSGNPYTFMMESLNESAHTPTIFLVGAGLVMVIALFMSKKAQNVVKTSVDLSRQDEGDEMFGSSGVARTIVRTTMNVTQYISEYVPKGVSRWINTRFNSDEAIIKDGAAFDLVRASVNLVVAGLLIAAGTSLKLPLSTTYVAFMVAMGSSLADRAWSRESAVFRITGMLSVIGGWFITAGVAFVICFVITMLMFYGSFVMMAILIVAAIAILVRSNIVFSRRAKEAETDVTFTQMVKSRSKADIWDLLCKHIRESHSSLLKFIREEYKMTTDAFFQEEYRRLKRVKDDIEEGRKEWKRQRRRELIGMRSIDPMQAIERNTWFFLGSNSCEQMLYCLKRINDPSREHVGNNFSPVPISSIEPFLAMRDAVIILFERTEQMLKENDFSLADAIRTDSQSLQVSLSRHRKAMLDSMQDSSTNLEAMLVFVNIIQESQELIGSLRHMIRGVVKFQDGE